MFDLNFLRGNLKKYGTMLLSRNKGEYEIEIEVNGTQIDLHHNITLLGVNIDRALNFSDHLSYICKKASQQVGVIRRLRNLTPTSASCNCIKLLPSLSLDTL